MKLISLPYLHSTLTSLIRGLYASKESCEVDPSRLRLPPGKDPTDHLKRNWKRLLNHATIFWEAIRGSVAGIPVELVAVFADMANTAKVRFSGDGKVRYTVVSGFIFL